MVDETVLRLPTVGIAVGTDVDDNDVVSSPTQNQTTYDGLAAIYDAFDGGGTGPGIPPGWDDFYWSATPTTAQMHVPLHLRNGSPSSSGDDFNELYVALEVVFPVL